MKNRSINDRIIRYNNLSELIVKESDYLQVLKGYCENEMYVSEAAARILIVLENVCSLHEELYNQLDDLMIELGV